MKLVFNSTAEVTEFFAAMRTEFGKAEAIKVELVVDPAVDAAVEMIAEPVPEMAAEQIAEAEPELVPEVTAEPKPRKRRSRAKAEPDAEFVTKVDEAVRGIAEFFEGVRDVLPPAGHAVPAVPEMQFVTVEPETKKAEVVTSQPVAIIKPINKADFGLLDDDDEREPTAAERKAAYDEAMKLNAFKNADPNDPATTPTSEWPEMADFQPSPTFDRLKEFQLLQVRIKGTIGAAGVQGITQAAPAMRPNVAKYTEAEFHVLNRRLDKAGIPPAHA